MDERELSDVRRREDLPPVAHRVADELVAEGAGAVVVAGSHARGEAGPDSDLDLLAVGEESYPPRLDVREGVLISVSMQPPARHRESFEEPELMCEGVPGWREALVLRDPSGVGAALVREAREWTWGPREERCDAWVAEEVTARAETVHKLVSALGRGDPLTASAKRHLLATRLARAMAVHHRVLYGSETRLWGPVSAAMGREWAEALRAALGRDGTSSAGSCVAALRMYGLASDGVAGLLDGRQTRVVRRARTLVGRLPALK